jgi:hypothetical protein
MKALIASVMVLGLLTGHALGQGAQADQVKRRAKDLSNQNSARQGVAPSAPARVSTTTATKATTATPPTAQQQNIAKLQADFAGFKPGSPATAEQKQQLTKDIAAACRGVKPSSPVITAFVNDLAAALADKTFDAPQRTRLAQDIEAVLNSAAMPASQFDAIIADVQAILQAGGAKRSLAASTANYLKVAGSEVRRGAAP